MLCHPNSGDFTGLTGGYKGVADSAVTGVAIESGPAFSTSTTYNDFPSSLAYINYYRSLLKQGYRLGASMDQDNHEMTYGTANANRLVVLAKDRSRESILSAIKAMRIYASNDYNTRVSFSINGYISGSSILSSEDLSGLVTHTDADGESLSAVQVYGGKVRGADATLIATGTANTPFTTAQAVGETWYYYAVLTQADGNKIVTSPIWVTKTAFPLPVTLTSFTASLNRTNSTVTINWNTASEENSDYFIVERSTDLIRFSEVGRVAAKGRAADYSLLHLRPEKGMNYYRLRQVDKDGHITYSKVVSMNLDKVFTVSVSPNPSKGSLTVKVDGSTSDKRLVQVIDMAGNSVYNREHTGNNITLDLSALPAGSYIIRVGDTIKQFVISK